MRGLSCLLAVLAGPALADPTGEAFLAFETRCMAPLARGALGDTSGLAPLEGVEKARIVSVLRADPSLDLFDIATPAIIMWAPNAPVCQIAGFGHDQVRVRDLFAQWKPTTGFEGPDALGDGSVTLTREIEGRTLRLIIGHSRSRDGLIAMTAQVVPDAPKGN